jgi:hypothetical protein
MYKITPYTYLRAKQLGVQVKPSKNINKKIDVFKNGVKVASVGDSRYLDYPTYKKKYGLPYAIMRRKLFKLRNKKNAAVIGSPAYYAYNLLW